MSVPTTAMTEEQRQQLLRWRLVLGSRAQKCQCGAKGGPECSCTGSAMDLAAWQARAARTAPCPRRTFLASMVR